MKLRMNHITENSHIYGFEPTFTIWTQGCSIRCKNCWNKFTWDPKKGYDIEVDDLIEKFLESGNNCITILGGEPLDQEEAVLELITKIKKLEKGVILYTGREKYQISEKAMEVISKTVDILISGPYVDELRTTSHQMIGSTNQKIENLTDRYDLKDLYNGTVVEIDFNEDTAAIDIMGYPEEFLGDDFKPEGY